MKIPMLLLLGIIFIGCQPEKKSSDTKVNDSTSVTLKYAEGFKVTEQHGCKLVEVAYPYQGAASGYKYLLVPSGQDVPTHDADVKVIHTPITSIVCTSTTHIPLLD